jgi:hypothetical protein
MRRHPCNRESIRLPNLPSHFVLTPVEHGQGFT